MSEYNSTQESNAAEGDTTCSSDEPSKARSIRTTTHLITGSITHQVAVLFDHSGIDKIGSSRHEAKEIALARLAEQGISATKHNLGKNMGVHGYRHADELRRVWRELANYAKSEHGIRNIRELTGGHVRDYLASKVDQGVKMETVRIYSSYCEKLETALNRWSERFASTNSFYFGHDIQFVRDLAKDEGLRQGTEARAYRDPEALVRNVQGEKPEKFALAARIQHEGGARISEVSRIRENDLRGLLQHPTRGVQGAFNVEGKGGKFRLIYISEGTYKLLESAIRAAGGEWGLQRHRNRDLCEHRAYGRALKEAAQHTGQHYSGSHGLRHSFAQARMNELIASGVVREVALYQVSKELGHQRPDISEHYLRC
ncbi:MAG: site-specific integrase [Thermodesulfobacteriota bacterium]